MENRIHPNNKSIESSAMKEQRKRDFWINVYAWSLLALFVSLVFSRQLSELINL